MKIQFKIQLIKLVVVASTSFFLTACGCKTSYMPENYIVKPEDKNLNCQEIIYAINETEFWIKNVNERCRQPHVFAKFIPCLPMVKLDAMRNEYTLSDRVDYLRSLYKLKGCEFAIKLKGSSVEKQSTRIGAEKYNIRSIKTELEEKTVAQPQKFITKNDVITDIPINIKR